MISWSKRSRWYDKEKLHEIAAEAWVGEQVACSANILLRVPHYGLIHATAGMDDSDTFEADDIKIGHMPLWVRMTLGALVIADRAVLHKNITMGQRNHVGSLRPGR